MASTGGRRRDGNLLINRPKKCTRYIIFIYFHDTYLYSITAEVAGPVQPGDRVWWWSSSSSAGISSSISRTFIHLCLWWLCCYAMPTSVGGHSNEELLLLRGCSRWVRMYFNYIITRRILDWVLATRLPLNCCLDRILRILGLKLPLYRSLLLLLLRLLLRRLHYYCTFCGINIIIIMNASATQSRNR